jgi:hypothetical protein
LAKYQLPMCIVTYWLWTMQFCRFSLCKL